jgi:hypothetical protein
MASLEGLGTHVFRGAIAEPYLSRQGLPSDTLESGDWAKDERADKVTEKTFLMGTFVNFIVGRSSCVGMGY